MKRTILISTLFLLNFGLSSQTWIDSNAKWTFDYWNIAEWGTYTFSYVNDTIILGQECETIETIKYRYWEDQFGNIYSSTFQFPNQYTYSSGDSVFHLYEGTFYLLYDFAASIGDSWIIAVNDDFPCNDTSIVQVTDTGTVDINSQKFRTITLETISNSAIGLTGTCVEKFGNESIYYPDNSLGPFPGLQSCPGFIIDHDMLTFRCYWDDNFETYNPTNIECDYLTVVSEYTDSDFKIYPNPTNGEFTIEFHESVSFELYNIKGQIVKQFDLQFPENKINIADLNNGMYIIKIITEQKSIIKKIIKK